MLKYCFEKEIEEIDIILNEKNIFQNLLFKLNRDKNIEDFLINIEKNINLWIKKDFYKNEYKTKVWFDDVIAFNKIIKSIYKLFKRKNKIYFNNKELTEKEILSNFYMSDGYGKYVLRYISYIPLIDKILETNEYLNIHNKLNYLNQEKTWEKDYEEEKYQSLYEDGFFGKYFVNLNEYFKEDNKKELEIFLINRIKDFEKEKEKSIEEIILLLEIFNKLKDNTNLGFQYYINKEKDLEEKNIENTLLFKNIFEKIIKNKKDL